MPATPDRPPLGRPRNVPFQAVTRPRRRRLGLGLAGAAIGTGLLAPAPATAGTATDAEPPGSPPFVEATVGRDGVVTLDWGRSTDDTGVVDYRVLRNGDELLRTGDPRRRVVLDALPHGSSWLQLQAIDGAGNESVRTSPVEIYVDRRNPSAPQGLRADVRVDGAVATIHLAWDASRDDAGVEAYVVLESLRQVGMVGPAGAPQTVIDVDREGRHWLQVQAIDAAGNRSVRSAPLEVDVAPVVRSASPAPDAESAD